MDVAKGPTAVSSMCSHYFYCCEAGEGAVGTVATVGTVKGVGNVRGPTLLLNPSSSSLLSPSL